MKTLPTLIKLHKQDLDTLLIAKRHLMQQIQEQEQQLTHHLEQAQIEFRQYINTNLSHLVHQYTKMAQKRTDQMRAYLANLNAELAVVECNITQAFVELRKYETLQENIYMAAQQEEQRAEVKELDALGLLVCTESS